MCRMQVDDMARVRRIEKLVLRGEEAYVNGVPVVPVDVRQADLHLHGHISVSDKTLEQKHLVSDPVHVAAECLPPCVGR